MSVNNDYLVQSTDPDHPANLIPDLCKRFFYNGWCTGTGGGTSIKQDNHIFIAPSGVQKEMMKSENIFVMEFPTPKYPPSERKYIRKPLNLKPSACTPLFLAAFERGAGCCIHSHSQWCVLVTLLVEKLYGKDACFEINNIEQIKGIPKGPGKGMLGFHDTLRIPIIENTSFEEDLTGALEEAMEKYPDTYAILVRRHGIYVWGDSVAKAKTQCESLDYLFQLAVEMYKLGLPWLKEMPYINSPVDGAQLYYVDYCPAKEPTPFQPSEDRQRYEKNDVALVFIHGWPMSSKMYEHLMLAFCESYGIRCIASDRRGFGKSEWTGTKTAAVTYDMFADDTLAIVKSAPNLDKFIFVASSMGCGESVLVYELMKAQGIANQCQGFVWLGPSMPFPIATEGNPKMPSREVWDSLLNGFRQDRVGFVRAAIGSVFGVPSGIEMSETALEFFINIVNQADAIAIERCVQIITSYDFTEKLKQLQKQRILILHGDSDSGMPAEPSAFVIQKLLPGSKVKIYEKAAHGLYYTHSSTVMDDILAMISEISTV